MSSYASELGRDIESAANFNRDRLGDWEPRDGMPVAQVDAEWLLRLMRAYQQSIAARYRIRDLALTVGLNCTIPEFETKDGE